VSHCSIEPVTSSEKGFYFFKLINCMEHIIVDWTFTILGSLVAVIGGAIGLKVASKMGSSMDNRVFNDRLELLQDENKELKKYLKSNKGALAQLKQGLTIPEGTNIEEMDENGTDGVIKGLIGKYSGMCPPQFRPLLQDPAIVSFLLSEAKKHPEETKEVLKHFIGGNGKIGTESSGEQSPEQQYEDSVEGA